MRVIERKVDAERAMKLGVKVTASEAETIQCVIKSFFKKREECAQSKTRS